MQYLLYALRLVQISKDLKLTQNPCSLNGNLYCPPLDCGKPLRRVALSHTGAILSISDSTALNLEKWNPRREFRIQEKSWLKLQALAVLSLKPFRATSSLF
jgi:hypothetical protein